MCVFVYVCTYNVHCTYVRVCVYVHVCVYVCVCVCVCVRVYVGGGGEGGVLLQVFRLPELFQSTLLPGTPECTSTFNRGTLPHNNTLAITVPIILFSTFIYNTNTYTCLL